MKMEWLNLYDLNKFYYLTIFNSCLSYPFDTNKSVGSEEFHVTAYFWSK